MTNTMTIFRDSGGDGRYHLSATIEGTDYEIGDYADIHECGSAMLRWMSARGLTNEAGTGARLANNRSDLFTFGLVRRADIGLERGE